MSENQQIAQDTVDYSEQEQIRRDKLQALMQSGENPYLITKYDVTHESKAVIDQFDALEGQTVSMAGRMIGRHIMGKASFARILDGAGKIQIYVKRDDLGEEPYAAFKKYDLGVQTHLVESKAEAAWAKELYPEFGSDGQIYESCGLLQGKGPKIFAHVIFPSEVEERILKEYDGISVHCPDATSNITAGIMPASAMHEKGLKIALGSDVGGGHFLGIYRQIARAAQISKMKEFYEEDYKRIKLANAFYMATVTGGSIFDRVGKLEKGYRFNALIIDNMLDEEYATSLQDALERFCYIGDERNIFERYIDGVRVDPEAVYQKLINM